MFSFAGVDQPGVVIEAVKRAEDSDDTILRVYEAHGRRRRATLTTALPILSASLCNLMEEQDEPVSHGGRELTFELRPFEIKTFKLGFGALREEGAQ